MKTTNAAPTASSAKRLETHCYQWIETHPTHVWSRLVYKPIDAPQNAPFETIMSELGGIQPDVLCHVLYYPFCFTRERYKRFRFAVLVESASGRKLIPLTPEMIQNGR
jgi:hypothetical protein